MFVSIGLAVMQAAAPHAAQAISDSVYRAFAKMKDAKRQKKIAKLSNTAAGAMEILAAVKHLGDRNNPEIRLAEGRLDKVLSEQQGRTAAIKKRAQAAQRKKAKAKT